MKISVLILILFFAIIFLITPSKAQTIDPIKADTVFEGYGSGVTSSIKFINHKRNLVYNHDGKLYEMSVANYKPLRQIQLDEANPVTKFDIDDNCKYIIYYTNSDAMTFIADYNTGKTIKTLIGSFYLTRDYLFIKSPLTGGNYSNINSIYKKFRINDMIPVDSFGIYKSGNGGMDILRYGKFMSVYNKNTIYFEVEHADMEQGGGAITQTEWFMIDPITNQMKGTPFSTGGSSGTLFSSKTGNTIAFLVSGSIGIYDSSIKFLAEISQSELKKYYNDADFSLLSDINFINDRYLISSIKYNNGLKIVQNIQVYDILKKKAIKFIDFENYRSACEDDKFIFSNKSGCLATLELEEVPVQENIILTNEYTVSYSNNSLLISTDETQQVNIIIMNITSVEVETLGNIYLSEGSNTIPLNTQLANGLYFCIIKTQDNTISRKFMVIE